MILVSTLSSFLETFLVIARETLVLPKTETNLQTWTMQKTIIEQTRAQNVLSIVFDLRAATRDGNHVQTRLTIQIMIHAGVAGATGSSRNQEA